MIINAGDPASPVGLEPFFNGGSINMGAYGGTAEASKSYFGEPVCEIIVAGDINGDCKVDFKDFALMASTGWRRSNMKLKIAWIKSRAVLTMLIFLAYLCIVTAKSWARYSGGTGDPNDPYQIATPEDLNDIGNHQDDWDKNFVLVNDVNLAQYTGTQFKIIGNRTTMFTGVFDGNDHKIWNFAWSSTGRNYIGLFGWVGSGGQIKNLGMENVNVNITNGNYVGGLVGENVGIITNCYSTSDVGAEDEIGGLVGWSIGSVSNCYSTGSVSGCYDVGGLAGQNKGSISNCYSTGDVGAEDEIGGLVGRNSFWASVSNCFWDTETQTHAVTESIGLNEGTATNVAGLPTAEMKTKSTFTTAGWDFVEIWGIGENQTYPYLRFAPAGDINYDKKVDLVDLAILASHWLECIGPNQGGWRLVEDDTEDSYSCEGNFDIFYPCSNAVDEDWDTHALPADLGATSYIYENYIIPSGIAMADFRIKYQQTAPVTSGLCTTVTDYWDGSTWTELNYTALTNQISTLTVRIPHDALSRTTLQLRTRVWKSSGLIGSGSGMYYEGKVIWYFLPVCQTIVNGDINGDYREDFKAFALWARASGHYQVKGFTSRSLRCFSC